jgi:uncharacterized delta-60 repeat protein
MTVKAKGGIVGLVVGTLVLVSSAFGGSVASLDGSFGKDGRVFTSIGTLLNNPGSVPISRGIAEDASGRLVVATGAGVRIAIFRYRANGQLDTSFGNEGRTYITLDIFPPTKYDAASAFDVAFQSDGKILIGGTYNGRARLIRLNPDGSLDTSFAAVNPSRIPGIWTYPPFRRLSAIETQGSRILIGGSTDKPGASRFTKGYVARLTQSGKFDESFGSDGIARFVSKKNTSASIADLVIGGNKIYAAGQFNRDFLLARLTKNGKPDPTFGKSGRVVTNASKRKRCRCSTAEGLARDERGRLVVSGFIEPKSGDGSISPRAIAVARYRSNGALDKSFGNSGITRTKLAGFTVGRKVAVQPDGRIIVAGAYATATWGVRDFTGPPKFTVVRYLTSGKLDRSFFGDGVFARKLGVKYPQAWVPILDRRGRVVVVGGGVTKTKMALLLIRIRPGYQGAGRG